MKIIIRKSTKESEYIQFAKEDLDYAINHALSIKQFENILSSMGYKYYYRGGKLSIRKEPYKKKYEIYDGCDTKDEKQIKSKIRRKSEDKEQEKKLKEKKKKRQKIY